MHHSISLTMQGTNRIIHAKLVQKGIVVSFLTAHELILPWEIIHTSFIIFSWVLKHLLVPSCAARLDVQLTN